MGKKLALAVMIGIAGALYALLFNLAGPEHQAFVVFFSLVTVLVLSRKGQRSES